MTVGSMRLHCKAVEEGVLMHFGNCYPVRVYAQQGYAFGHVGLSVPRVIRESI